MLCSTGDESEMDSAEGENEYRHVRSHLMHFTQKIGTPRTGNAFVTTQYPTASQNRHGPFEMTLYNMRVGTT
jgi:hypothetical protein